MCVSYSDSDAVSRSGLVAYKSSTTKEVIDPLATEFLGDSNLYVRNHRNYLINHTT